MTNKPLQYDSLKTVLQYLEPNLRSQISHRCPSIHKTERTIPLYIDSLKFKNLKWSSGKACAVSVNSTDYTIGTIRVYPDEVETPRTHMKQNEDGGVGTDLEQFGFEDFSSESHLTPGDVTICKQVGQIRRVFTHNFFRQQEEQLQLLEAQLATFRETSTKLKSHEVKRHSEKVSKSLQVEIEKKRTLLLPYHHRRDNTPRDYDTIVQLTMQSKDGLRIQQFPGKKMYQVEKRLNEFLFADRKTISVKRLDLSQFFGVFRIPVGFRIKAQQLKCKHDEYQHLEAISQFLHMPSLQCLELSTLLANQPQHTILTTAKTLSLECFHANMQTFLDQVSNQIVEVHSVGFSAEDYLMLVRNFIETRRPVGTCYSFVYNTLELLAETIIMELNGKQLEKGGVKVPIDESSELQITHKMRYRIKFEVVGV